MFKALTSLECIGLHCILQVIVIDAKRDNAAVVFGPITDEKSAHLHGETSAIPWLKGTHSYQMLLHFPNFVHLLFSNNIRIGFVKRNGQSSRGIS